MGDCGGGRDGVGCGKVNMAQCAPGGIVSVAVSKGQQGKKPKGGPRGRPFPKGVCPNPGGKRKGPGGPGGRIEKDGGSDRMMGLALSRVGVRGGDEVMGVGEVGGPEGERVDADEGREVVAPEVSGGDGEGGVGEVDSAGGTGDG